MFEGFDMTPIEKHKKKYGAEARQRYGDEAVDAVKSGQRSIRKRIGPK
jgi:hypothetical protein